MDKPDYEKGQCDVWDDLCYSDRLEIAEFIFKKITHSPCSFRRLIYSRLGFDTAAYSILYQAGGMEITNSVWSAIPSTAVDIKQMIMETPIDEYGR